MTRLLLVCPATLLAILMVADPAHASLGDWLDKLEALSGPGPFVAKFSGNLDVFCWEGAYWEDPITRQLDVGTARLEPEILGALADESARQSKTDPFALLKTLTAAMEAASSFDNASKSTLGAALLAKVKAQPKATLAIARRQLRIQFWQWREAALQSRDGSLAAVLRSGGYEVDEQSPEYIRLQRTVSRMQFAPFCTGDLRNRRYAVGFYGGWFISEGLPGLYNFDAAKADRSHVVNALPLAVTYRQSLPFTRRKTLLRSIDIGASAGIIVFNAGRSAPNERFPMFKRRYFEPVRLAVRPLSFMACRGGCRGEWTRWDLLEVETAVKYIGATAPGDFGALSGPDDNDHWQIKLRAGLTFKFKRDSTYRELRED